jgi:hypothetical protein
MKDYKIGEEMTSLQGETMIEEEDIEIIALLEEIEKEDRVLEEKISTTTKMKETGGEDIRNLNQKTVIKTRERRKRAIHQVLLEVVLPLQPLRKMKKKNKLN